MIKLLRFINHFLNLWKNRNVNKYIIWECEDITRGWVPRAFIGSFVDLIKYANTTSEDCMMLMTCTPILISQKAKWKELATWKELGELHWFPNEASKEQPR